VGLLESYVEEEVASYSVASCLFEGFPCYSEDLQLEGLVF